jgi:alanine dehydrogenase
MLIGVPSEIKDQEYRVGLTPASAREIVAQGHEVLVQASAPRMPNTRRPERESPRMPKRCSRVRR